MKVSVVIPCYNDGHFLENGIRSVTSHPGFPEELEIIIVNDGSTDSDTLKILDKLEMDGAVRILHQNNNGPSSARNHGIRESTGTTILPLDSDNSLTNRYIDIAFEMADKNSLLHQKYDIVYGNPIFQGSDLRQWNVKEFDIAKIIWGNYVDTCAIFKKSVWEKIGGFDEHKDIRGLEDWEFWIRAYKNQFKFKYINEDLYHYLFRQDSVMGALMSNQHIETGKYYVYKKHFDVVFPQLEHLQKAAISYYENEKMISRLLPVKFLRDGISSIFRWFKKNT